MLSNSGTATLNISSIGLTGVNTGDFTESNTCGSSVNVNANCKITVVFKPQGTNVRLADVTITDNASDSPQQIGVSGVGAAPFSFVPTTPTTQNAQPGQKVQYGLQFTPNANFTGIVQFGCTPSPAGPHCSVSPASAPVNGPNSVPIMVSAVAPMAAAAQRAGSLPVAGPLSVFILFLAAVLMVLTVKRVSTWPARFGLRQIRLSHAALAAAITALLVATACGGSGGGNPTGPQNFTLTVTASSGQSALPVTLNLIVQ